MFSMKLIKCVVSLMSDSCFLAIGCKSESTKLDIRSVGPPLPETIGLPTGTGLCERLSSQSHNSFPQFEQQ